MGATFSDRPSVTGQRYVFPPAVTSGVLEVVGDVLQVGRASLDDLTWPADQPRHAAQSFLTPVDSESGPNSSSDTDR